MMPPNVFGGGGGDCDGGPPVYGMMPGGMLPGPMMPVMMSHGMPGVPGIGDSNSMPFPQPGLSQSAPKAEGEEKKDVQLVVKLKTGGSVKFKIKTATPLRKLMDA